MKRRAWQVAVSGAVVSTALVVLTSGSARSVQEMPVAEPIVVSQAYAERSDRLRRNETLSHMFARQKVEGAELRQLLEAARPHGLDPRHVTSSQVFDFRYVIGRDVPDRVRTRISEDAFLQLQRDSAGKWEAFIDSIQWAVVQEYASGTINSSLNDAVHRAIADSVLPFGHRDRLIWNVAEDVYGWVIDFTRDNRPGDRFDILYERLVSSAGDVRYGRLLAASIETGGKPNTAYVMSDGQNRNVYYDGNGRSMKRALLRNCTGYRRNARTPQRSSAANQRHGRSSTLDAVRRGAGGHRVLEARTTRRSGRRPGGAPHGGAGSAFPRPLQPRSLESSYRRHTYGAARCLPQHGGDRRAVADCVGHRSGPPPKRR